MEKETENVKTTKTVKSLLFKKQGEIQAKTGKKISLGRVIQKIIENKQK